jgi:hypothetical protein
MAAAIVMGGTVEISALQVTGQTEDVDMLQQCLDTWSSNNVIDHKVSVCYMMFVV